MFSRFLTLILIGSAFVLGACDKPAEEHSPVVLQVAGRSIDMEQFQREIDQLIPDETALSSKEEVVDLKRSFLRQLIDRELTLAEADRLGMTVTPEELEARVSEYRRDYPAGEFERMLGDQQVSIDQWRSDLRDRLRMEKVVEEQVYRRLKVDETELETYYREHRDAFDRPEQVRARQIVVAEETEGQRLLGLLRQGESFASVAKAHSLSPDGEKGGDLGFFARGEMPPEFDEVVFSLPVGRLSDLIKTDYGFHIFLVEEKRPAQKLSLAEVRSTVEDTLLAGKKEQAYQSWLRGLGSRATIEVNWSLLDDRAAEQRESR